MISNKVYVLFNNDYKLNNNTHSSKKYKTCENILCYSNYANLCTFYIFFFFLHHVLCSILHRF